MWRMEQISTAWLDLAKKLVDSSGKIILLLTRWIPDRELVALLYNSFFAIDLLDAARSHVSMITRLRQDARLFGPAPSNQNDKGPASQNRAALSDPRPAPG